MASGGAPGTPNPAKMEQHHRQIGSMAFFTPEQLEDTPSRRDGMSADMERGYRRHAHQIIVAVCNALVM